MKKIAVLNLFPRKLKPIAHLDRLLCSLLLVACSQSLAIISNSASASQPTPKRTNLTIGRIRIQGNKLISDETIKNAIGVRVGAQYDRAALLEGLKSLYELGYFEHTVEIDPSVHNGRIQLLIQVKEGPVLRHVRFYKNTVVDTDELHRLFEPFIGHPLAHEQLQALIEDIEKLYFDQSYVYCHCTQIHSKAPQDLELLINEGVVDKIEIVGNRRTKDFIIRNAIRLKPGSVYNESVRDDLKKMYANGYFNDINYGCLKTSANPDHYTLFVQVWEKPVPASAKNSATDIGDVRLVRPRSFAESAERKDVLHKLFEQNRISAPAKQ